MAASEEEGNVVREARCWSASSEGGGRGQEPRNAILEDRKGKKWVSHICLSSPDLSFQSQERLG